MTILSTTTISPGLVGVYPRLIYIATNDTLATVTTTGYLNSFNLLNPGQLIDGDMALVITKTTPSAANVDSGFLQVNHSGSNWSLIETNSPGSVTLPTIASHIATYTNTTGGLSEDPTTAISGGNIQAGLSGTAGYLASFPATAARGQLQIKAANNSANFTTIITNTSMGQATTITIPDPGVAAATFVLSDGSTQQIATGNLQTLTGNMIAGSSGHAGTFISFPSTAANGTLILAASDAGGAFNSTITSGTIAQNTVYHLVDPGVTTTNFLLSDNAGSQFINTGNLQVKVGLILGGNIGSNAGQLVLYSSGAANGQLKLLNTLNASGNFDTTITNAAAIGQSQVISIPNAGAATANFALAPAALVSGNLIKASGTAGLIVDAGIVATSVAISKITSPDAQSDLIWYDITASAAALASAGKVNVQVSSGAKQYCVRNVFVNYGAAGLSGGGGDRLLVLTDGVTLYNSVGITAALLGTPVNTVWGGTGNPLPGAFAISTPTVAGANLYLQYSGGAADFASGSIIISVCVERVA